MISPLAKKLLLKPGYRVLLINAPENYQALLEPLPEACQLCYQAEGGYDLLQVFVMNRKELKKELNSLLIHLPMDTVFWVSYPKKSSGLITDLEMSRSWDETTAFGLSPVASAAINDRWTALRFRRKDRIKRSAISNSAIPKISLGKYIDVKNRLVTLPPELHTALESRPEVLAFFESLSFTNKKEYVIWVMSAKQEKTRQERISKTVEKLKTGKRNTAEK